MNIWEQPDERRIAAAQERWTADLKRHHARMAARIMAAAVSERREDDGSGFETAAPFARAA